MEKKERKKEDGKTGLRCCRTVLGKKADRLTSVRFRKSRFACQACSQGCLLINPRLTSLRGHLSPFPLSRHFHSHDRPTRQCHSGPGFAELPRGG